MVGKFYLLLFAIAISSYSSFAQCSRLIVLSTQADVDAFPSTYGCSVVGGSLSILGYPTGDITNLDSLSIIERIDGYLNIQANVWLTDTDGLRNLKSVGDYVSVSDNSRLFNIEGLSGLEQCDNLNLSGGELEDLTGLRNLKKCRDLSIVGQRRITTLDGLQNLTSMYGLRLNNNPHLTDLSALRGPRTITWILSVRYNPVLTSLAGLEDLDLASGGVIDIFKNSGLITLDGLTNLDTLNEVIVYDNPQLTDVSALGSLTSVGRLWISYNPMLSNLGDYPNLHHVTELSIEGNPLLTTLEGLSALTSVDDLELNYVGATNLHGLHNVTKCDGSLWVGNNPDLTDLSGLEKVETVGHLMIYGNSKLTSLNGLSSLRTINGKLEPAERHGLTLYNNDALNDITALGQITTIHGDMTIEYNDSLRTLHGLEGLTSVEGITFIHENNSLETIAALSNISTMGIGRDTMFESRKLASFYVTGNSSLTDLGITGVRSMPGPLRITFNSALEDLNDLAALEQASELVIEDNEDLTSFCGLYKVISESGDDMPISLARNGDETTSEQIIADGPCSGEPEPQPGEFTFTNITDTTMTVSFAPDSIAPTGGYLLLLRAHNSPYPEDVPQDGSQYNVGQVIGSSTIVVGKGSGNEFNIVYLSPATTYHFALFSFDNQFNYATSNPLLGSQATLEESEEPQDPIAQPTSLAFADVTDNSLTVSFTASTSANVDGYITIMRAYSSSYPEDIPVDGTAYQVGNVIGSSSIVVGRGTATTLNIIYLSPNTDYWFDVYSYTNDGTYDYVTTSPLEGMQRTEPSMAAAAYPNPFAESVTIRFTVKQEKAHVKVTIFDSMGSTVAELLNGEVDRGMHEVLWSGIDARGNKASGMYHYSIVGHDEPVRGTVVAK